VHVLVFINYFTERTLLFDAESCVTLSSRKDRYIIKNAVRCAAESDVAKMLDYEFLYQSKNMQVRKSPIFGKEMLYFTFTSTFLPGNCFQKRSTFLLLVCERT